MPVSYARPQETELSSETVTGHLALRFAQKNEERVSPCGI